MATKLPTRRDIARRMWEGLSATLSNDANGLGAYYLDPPGDVTPEEHKEHWDRVKKVAAVLCAQMDRRAKKLKKPIQAR